MKIIDKYGRKIVTFGRADVRVGTQKAVDLTNDGLGGQLDVTDDNGNIIRVHAPSIGVYIVNSLNRGIALYGGSMPSLTLQDQAETYGTISLDLASLSVTLYQPGYDSARTGLYGGETPSLKMLGTQVVGPPATAVPDATGLSDVKDRLNDLLDRLRNHGLIGT